MFTPGLVAYLPEEFSCACNCTEKEGAGTASFPKTVLFKPQCIFFFFFLRKERGCISFLGAELLGSDCGRPALGRAALAALGWSREACLGAGACRSPAGTSARFRVLPGTRRDWLPESPSDRVSHWLSHLWGHHTPVITKARVGADASPGPSPRPGTRLHPHPVSATKSVAWFLSAASVSVSGPCGHWTPLWTCCVGSST